MRRQQEVTANEHHSNQTTFPLRGGDMDQVSPFPPIGSVTLLPNGSAGSEDKLLVSGECVGQRVRPIGGFVQTHCKFCT